MIIEKATGFFPNKTPNRAKRRESLQKQRFHGNGNNHHLTVSKNAKYKRVRQVIPSKIGGKAKVIEHYLEVK